MWQKPTRNLANHILKVYNLCLVLLVPQSTIKGYSQTHEKPKYIMPTAPKHPITSFGERHSS